MNIRSMVVLTRFGFDPQGACEKEFDILERMMRSFEKFLDKDRIVAKGGHGFSARIESCSDIDRRVLFDAGFDSAIFSIFGIETESVEPNDILRTAYGDPASRKATVSGQTMSNFVYSRMRIKGKKRLSHTSRFLLTGGCALIDESEEYCTGIIGESLGKIPEKAQSAMMKQCAHTIVEMLNTLINNCSDNIFAIFERGIGKTTVVDFSFPGRKSKGNTVENVLRLLENVSPTENTMPLLTNEMNMEIIGQSLIARPYSVRYD